MKLDEGKHDYEAILEGMRAGRFRFAEAETFAGTRVPIIGLSPEQFGRVTSLAGQRGLSLVLYGSRVVGPRTWQRRLHRVLEQGVSLRSTGRHQSVGYPAVEGVVIPKHAIKELGVDDPQTSDLTVAVLTEGRPLEDLLPVALDFERKINRELEISFQIRVYLEIFGHHFTNVQDFVKFGKERYVKKDLPLDCAFGDAEIEEAFKMLFVFIDRVGSGHNEV